MTREAFIRKWLANRDYDYSEKSKNLMRDDLDKVTAYPEPFTGEMWSFLLANALRFLTEEQRAGLCFDLYSRSELTKSIDERIADLKEKR
jgi:hypothetical protein